MRRLLVVLVVLFAFVAGGCNGDDKKVEAGARDNDATEDDAGSGDADKEFSGKGSGKFCDKSREVQEEFEGVFNEADTPEEFRAAFGEISDAIGDLVDLAPSEIRGDAKLIRDNFARQREVLEKYNYDFTKVPQEEQQAFQDPETQAASERLEKYNSEVCGIDTETDTTS